MPTRLRVMAIWTRDQTASASTGRGQLIGAIRMAMEARFDVEHVQLRHVLDPKLRSQLWRLLPELWQGLRARRALPLQCLIYLPHWQLAPLLAARTEPAPDIVYLDGIRGVPFLATLRRAFPAAPIVVDMDDLMSRRWPSLRRAGVGLTFGFLERYLPSRLLPLLQQGFLARWILAFETRTLRALELKSAAEADLVVFNSPTDAGIYSRLVDRHGRRRADVAVIMPPAPKLPPAPRWTGAPKLRFVFIGTDQIPQNWLSIDHLVSMWQRLAPPAELVIVGRLQRSYPICRNVTYAGFVADLRDVYTADSVLLTPAFAAGGVKTKVIEAFAYGCPVLGNHATFDGLPLPKSYPLRLPLPAIDAVVAQPEQHLNSFLVAAEMGQALVNGAIQETVFMERWAAALTPSHPLEHHDGRWRRQAAAPAVAASQDDFEPASTGIV